MLLIFGTVRGHVSGKPQGAFRLGADSRGSNWLQNFGGQVVDSKLLPSDLNHGVIS